MEVPSEWQQYLSENIAEFFSDDQNVYYRLNGIHLDCQGFYWEFQRCRDGLMHYLPISEGEFPEDYAFENLNR